jgi:ankyrin repeat protein
MKNPYIIPSLIIAAAILGGFWMVKPPPQPPDISIHQAAKEGNIVAVKQHLAAGTNANVWDKQLGETPLLKAASWGHKETAELLIANGADVNAKNRNGSTPLHNAAIGGHNEIVKLLIAAGADVNAKRSDGATPLDLAIKKNHTEIADLFRKHGGKTKKELEGEGK